MSDHKALSLCSGGDSMVLSPAQRTKPAVNGRTTSEQEQTQGLQKQQQQGWRRLEAAVSKRAVRKPLLLDGTPEQAMRTQDRAEPSADGVRKMARETGCEKPGSYGQASLGLTLLLQVPA